MADIRSGRRVREGVPKRATQQHSYTNTSPHTSIVSNRFLRSIEDLAADHVNDTAAVRGARAQIRETLQEWIALPV